MKNLVKITALLLTAWGLWIAGAYAAGENGKDSAVTVEDDAGRKIRVDRPFTRIISLYPAHTENLFSLGLDKEIIGVSGSHPYPPKAAEKPRFSYHDDPERFLAATPDLVLIRPMIDRAYPRLVNRLEQSGIVVFSLQPGSVAEMYAYWEKLGALIGKSHQASRMIRRFSSAVDAFKKLTSDVSPKKRVYFEAIHSRMKTFTPGSMALFVLEAAGGVNAAPDAVAVRGTNIAQYGKERILSRARQIDVFLAQIGAMNRVTAAAIKQEPGFSAIKAVADNHVFLVKEELVSRPTLRLLEGIAHVGGILYPKRFGPAAEPIIKAAFSAE